MIPTDEFEYLDEIKWQYWKHVVAEKRWTEDLEDHISETAQITSRTHEAIRQELHERYGRCPTHGGELLARPCDPPEFLMSPTMTAMPVLHWIHRRYPCSGFYVSDMFLPPGENGWFVVCEKCERMKKVLKFVALPYSIVGSLLE